MAILSIRVLSWSLTMRSIHSGLWALAYAGSDNYLNSVVLGEVDIRGNDIDTAPRHFGSARLAWTPTSDKIVELEWQSMGSYYLNPENLHQYQGHDLVHLRAVGLCPDQCVSMPTSVISQMSITLERADYTTFSQERYFPARLAACRSALSGPVGGRGWVGSSKFDQRTYL